MRESTTDFGYEQIPAEEKKIRVADVFHSVAPKYDLMNDLMSLGIHRLWKRFTIAIAHLRPGEQVLDLAGGTGDISSHLHRLVGNRGNVVLADINAAMLERGRTRLANQGVIGHISYVKADAEQLPFADNTFNCIIMAFGLRNVTHKPIALGAILRTLKPGGRVLILEFSHPIAPGLKPLYDLYSFTTLPLLGQWIANDAASYRYLAESIRRHPPQQALQTMMEDQGFERCSYFNLSGGIVAIHRGYKL